MRLPSFFKLCRRLPRLPESALELLAMEFAPDEAPGGRVILSGLLTHQEPQVRAAYAGRGLTLVNRRRLNGWSTLTYKRAG